MTIVKIKNPVLRWLAGLGIVTLIIVVTAIIIYALGCIAQKIYPFYLFRDGGSFGTMINGVVALMVFICCIIILAAICIVIYISAKILGEKFFDL